LPIVVAETVEGRRVLMEAGRVKGYDYGVMGLFAVVLAGVSLSWYTVSISLGGQSLSGGVSGWHYAWGTIAFVAALLAVVVVGLKGLVGAGGVLPGWYKEGPLVMGLGDLVTLFAIIGLLEKPGRGVDLLGGLGVKVGFGVGIYLTLASGLLIGGCGILAQRDKPVAATGIHRAPIGTPTGTWQAGPLLASGWPGEPALGGTTQGGPTVGGVAPGAVASVGAWEPGPASPPHCQACGAQLEAGSRFCRLCGRPQG
jgi:hypothetical protein